MREISRREEILSALLALLLLVSAPWLADLADLI